jgi:two-component system sensor histidine kinase/response regulator
LYRENNRSELSGIVILRIDPYKTLFPLIQSWPTPSKSSETLLFRREGDSVLYLNELRHQQNTALNLRLPVNRDSLLASKAVRGIRGIVEGVDYRNIPVLGYLAGIPGLPWYMVAKTDKKEIHAPLKRYLFISGVLIVLLILINGFIVSFWIWNQKLIFYKQQLQNEQKADEVIRKLNEELELRVMKRTVELTRPQNSASFSSWLY